MLREFKTHVAGLGNKFESVSIIYNTTTRFIESAERYRMVNQEKIRDYCECYDKDKKLTVDEYNNNIEIIMAIHKEMTTKAGLERIAQVFPKRFNGLFDIRKVMVIAKCMNAKCDGTTHGYVCNELRVKAINSRVLEIEYKIQNYIC